MKSNRYEIKNAKGETIFTTGDSHCAHACYNTLRDLKGYAELWYAGSCIFKTRRLA